VHEAEVGLPFVYDAFNVEADLKAAALPATAMGRKLLAAVEEVERDAVTRSAAVTACSAPDAAALAEHYGRDLAAFTVIPNGTDVPATVPTHFGPSGAPDAWSPRSIRSVMLLPFGALAIPAVLAVTACLSARAKRAIRLSDRGVSLEAQLRFRSATASFLSGVAILVALMMCGMSVAAVRTALGLAHGIPVWMMALAIVLVAYAIGGSLYIALRYGQGGARLERQAAGAPLTNGVADNSHWYLGGFYVNRDDPSWFVEKRFGLGYTINFGNPWAVGLLLVFLAVVATIVVSGLLTPQTTTPPIR
jgi:uncharacterized membrane protein